jgi:hypothetical protein
VGQAAKGFRQKANLGNQADQTLRFCEVGLKGLRDCPRIGAIHKEERIVSSTFIALPLKSGEAFLLRTPDANGQVWNILVDGGKAYGEGTRELADKLAEVSPKIERLDVVICTHSDADHSQGLWYLADDWYAMGRSIGEFWLPGRWANAVPLILTDPSAFVDKLRDGALEAGARVSRLETSKFGVSREDRYYKASAAFVEGELQTAVTPISEAFLDGDEQTQGQGLGLGLTEFEIGALQAAYDETDNEVDPFDANLKRVQLSDHWTWFLDPHEPMAKFLEADAAFAEVAETAKAIQKIATAALVHRIKTRWFDFGEYKKTDKPFGGIPGLLEPCCSVEVVPDRSKVSGLSSLSLFHSLRLTRQNVESIVFYRPETNVEPGVLILGDSRLAHGIERPEKNFPAPFARPDRKVLVTAPHHGSRNNDNAFEVLKDWLGTDQQVFVRNGGQTGQTLAEYLTHPDRRCAQCIQCHGKDWHQWVSVATDGTNWKWPPNAEQCGKPSP